MSTHTAIAAAASNLVRQAKSEVRRDIRSGYLPILQVLAAPPADLRGDLLIQVLELAPKWGRSRTESLGRHAARDGVNLAVTLGRAPAETREWVAEKVCGGATLDGNRITFEQRLDDAAMTGDLDAARQLLYAIRDHRRMVASKDAPAEDFGQADDVLWRRARDIAGLIGDAA